MVSLTVLHVGTDFDRWMANLSWSWGESARSPRWRTKVLVDRFVRLASSTVRSNRRSNADAVNLNGRQKARGREEYAEEMFLDRITVDPERMNGRPCVRDLRVTVATVLGQLAAGQTREQILADYPYLEDEDITASLEYGAARVSEREVQVARPA
jgi:uncharacterized protein (DUF433 family)